MSKTKKRVLWSGLALTILSFATVALLAQHFPGRVKVEAASEHPVPSARKVIVPAEQTRADIPGLILALRPAGFTPPAIELTDGAYFFIVQNRSGIRDLTFQLFHDTGEKLYEVNDQRSQWKKEVALSPGTYVLSVVDHPKWRCLIKVKSLTKEQSLVRRH